MKTAVQAPASKSLSHRVLIAAALANGLSRLHRVSDCEDTQHTGDVLRAAGAGIQSDGQGGYLVRGMTAGPVGALDAGAAPLDCYVGESGTTCRLLTAVLASGRGRFRIHGAPRMHERPLGTLLRALEELGASCACEGAPGCAPVLLEARGLLGGEIVLPMDESSQYLSGLLLAAPFCREPLRVVIGGRKAVSWPYVGLTLQTLESFGIAFSVEQLKDGEWLESDFRTLIAPKPGEVRITVFLGAYASGEHYVEGDWSGASCLLAAGAVGKKPVYVQGLCANSIQGDRMILDILRSMGARVEEEPDGVSVAPSPLKGIDVDMRDCPDLVPAVAALAAFASGATRIRGVAHLRLKESDRIAVPAMELRKMGIRVDEKDDGLVVYGKGSAPDPSGCLFEAHNDHRIAMSLALFSLYGHQVLLDHPETVRKSFPNFWKVWEQVACPSEK